MNNVDRVAFRGGKKYFLKSASNIYVKISRSINLKYIIFFKKIYI